MMSNISMVEAKLPPGFRFHPRDEELICDYLMKKVTVDHHHRQEFDSPILIEVDLNKSEPWDIPETACVGGKDWYFYSQRDRKYATGLRTNRATATGYWKATGKDRPVLQKGSLVGMRKTLVFYQGRAPKGRKTDWVMHEFRLEGPFGPPKIPTSKEDWVLCRVFHKSKEESAKSSMGMSSCYEETSSMSLPALTDSYINFNTNNNNSNTIDDFEQVPCFSIFSQSQTSPSSMAFPPQFSNMDHHHQFPTNTAMSSTKNSNMVMVGGAGASSLEESNLDLDPFGSGKKGIRAVLDQYFSKIESSSIYNGAMRGSSTSCLGDGSSESFLSEMGMPNVLNLY